jgi:hypothetical protein
MATSLLDNLIAYYSFNNQTNADTSWNNNNISNTDDNTLPATYSTGLINSYCLQYSRSSPRGVYTTNSFIDNTKSFTIAFWYRASAINPVGGIYAYNLVGSSLLAGNTGFLTGVGIVQGGQNPFGKGNAPGSGNILYFYNDYSDTNRIVYYTPGVTTNTTYFVVAQYIRTSGLGTINISVNNGIVYTSTLVGSAPARYDGTTFDLLDSSTYLPQSGNTNIDEVMVWQRNLSTSEITSLYNSGSGFVYPFGNSGSLNALYSKHKGPANTRRLHNLGYF